jgi:hypothetical protein
MQPAAVRLGTLVLGRLSATVARRYVFSSRLLATKRLLIRLSSMDGVAVQICTVERAATPNLANATKPLSSARSGHLPRLQPAFKYLPLPLLRLLYLFPPTHDADQNTVARLAQEVYGATAALSTTGVAQARVRSHSTMEDTSDDSRPLCCEYLPKRLWKMQ